MYGSYKLKGSNTTIDLESGGTSSEDDKVKGPGLGGKKAKKSLGRLRSGSLGCNASISSNGDGLGSSDDGVSSGDNLEILVGEVKEEGVENKMVEEKRKKSSSKKPPKPPLPPRGPSWNVADMKLVREMSELARLKHARIERMKALKKKKADKGSSSSSSIVAMVITFLFFFVIIFQGFLGSRV